MTLRLVTPPTTLPISVAEAKANMRVTIDDDDALIQTLIRGALAYAEKTTGMAFEAQTWELVLDAFPANELMLTPGPVVSVTSVKYDDVDGFEQTVDPDDYEVDIISPDGWVVPSADWPTAMTTINAVRVLFVAGNGAPEDVRRAIFLLVGHWYNHRETAGAAMQEIPFGVDILLGLHRRIYV